MKLVSKLVVACLLLASYTAWADPYVSIVEPEDTSRNQMISVYQVELMNDNNQIVYNPADLTYTPAWCTGTEIYILPPDTVLPPIPDGMYLCRMLADYSDINLPDHYYSIRVRAYNINGWSIWTDPLTFEVKNGIFYKVRTPAAFKVRMRRSK